MQRVARDEERGDPTTIKFIFEVTDGLPFLSMGENREGNGKEAGKGV